MATSRVELFVADEADEVARGAAADVAETVRRKPDAAVLFAVGESWGARWRVPARAITAGMRVVLAARETILVVTGEHKRAIFHAMFEGPVTPDVPASYLRTIDRVRLYADRAAWQGATPPA